MFSPPAKKSGLSARKNVSDRRDEVSTPLADSRRPLLDSPTVVNRPATGTPAPWASRLSVLARIPPAKKSDRGDETDSAQPVYVGEFPQEVRDAQIMSSQNRFPADTSISGGMDKATSFAWIVCGNKLFIWNHLIVSASRKCIILDLDSVTSENGEMGKGCSQNNNWLVCLVNWHCSKKTGSKGTQQPSPAGIVMCNKKTRTVVFWPDIYNANVVPPLSCVASSEFEATYLHQNGQSKLSKQWQNDKFGNNFGKLGSINSLIAAAIPSATHSCIALACRSDGQIWRFLCTPTGIEPNQIELGMSSTFSPGVDSSQLVTSKGYPRSLTWHTFNHSSDDTTRQFLLLTNHEIQCFTLKLSAEFNVSELWSHEIIGTDGDLGIQKDLAGQKKIWPLDMDIDADGKVITVLVAIFCKDRVTSLSYTEYSLLTMQYKSGVDIAKPLGEIVLEKKAPIQVIVPKARVEDEEFLFSIRLKVGGKPAGSAIILSGDGTATVSHYWRSSTKLYQFDLPYDAGKVLDASVFPSLDDSEDGAWVVLTEKAGVWAIPERAVILGGVEPPERSLSRKGSSNDQSLQDERRNFPVAGNIAPRRASSEVWDAGDRQRPGLTGVSRRSPQDEESEGLLSQLFHDFLLSGNVDGVLDKLKNSRAFEREGGTNVFTRISKSIVDTLAKHWTTTRGPEIALSLASAQLVEKQQKHQKFLQFLALSKCHEELCSRQRESMQTIMEHGEKLAGMIQMRELQNTISHESTSGLGSSYSSDTQTSGALWDLIQLVGERARRNTVLLMDRDNAEVFYSKVSDLEEVFHCLERQLEYIISEDMLAPVQFRRVCELSSGCVMLFHAAFQYKSEYHLWYPPPEGLTPWYSKTVVWNGLWSVASFMLQLLNETNRLDGSEKFDFYSNLELLSEVLLESYSNPRTLLEEYWTRRDALLDALYKQVKSFVEAKLKDSAEENKEQHNDTLMTLSSKLLSIAKRHEAYRTVWSICCDLDDSELLQNLMHESMGPKGGFSCFVFKQLYESKQLSKLMRLGEEFPDELATFLQLHPDLLWLHEVFLHQFSSASETLHALSLSKDGSSVSIMEGTEVTGSRRQLSLASRKHFLNLAKISTMAARDVGYELKVRRIDADLNILQLQEKILTLLPDEEKQSIGEKLLPPIDLIELCLRIQHPELSLRAFDLFLWTSASFLRNNTSLLEDCWRNAANQDNWGELYQRSITEGWSDERTIEELKETVLFQASSKCYGPDAETFDGIGFNEVLPLRLESPDDPDSKYANSSVEAVLMQHKDYPEAGKLMLFALMVGSEWDASSAPLSVMDYEGSSPTE
ncbi:nuclear pore complex protein NUP133-like isoform X1 [Salvia splendens]|uniref:nuclear pore complex protein NUP133-like isoform X1 n=1 Tax=Salvia splendens TaxID=180675 RepID=UPI001C27627A|nr:nuclear pore complex protein NUP133-like isoform X1 [Salvia splendens]